LFSYLSSSVVAGLLAGLPSEQPVRNITKRNKRIILTDRILLFDFAVFILVTFLTVQNYCQLSAQRIDRLRIVIPFLLIGQIPC
jgi:hypothetical protein